MITKNFPKLYKAELEFFTLDLIIFPDINEKIWGQKYNIAVGHMPCAWAAPDRPRFDF